MRLLGVLICLLTISAGAPATNPSPPSADSLRQAAVVARARAELARANVLRQLNADSSYQKATVEVRDKQKRLDELRGDAGSPTERAEAATALAAARDRLTKMRTEAMNADPDVRAAAAEAVQADVAFAQAQKPPPEPQPLRLENILSQLPREALPDTRHGWDEFTAPKAHQVLKQRFAGEKVLVEGALLAAPDITRVKNAKHPDETDDWVITLKLQPTRSDARSVPTFLSIGTLKAADPEAAKARDRGTSTSVGIVVSEDQASRSRDWKENDRVWLAGTIQDITVTGGGGVKEPHSGTLTVILSDPSIVKTQPYKAPLPPAAQERHPSIHMRK